MAVRSLYTKLSQSPKYSSDSIVAFVPYQIIGLLVAILEAGMINLGSAVCKTGYVEVLHGGMYDSDSMMAVGLMASILYVSAARSSGLYRLPALIRPLKYLGRMAAVCTFVLMALTAVLFVLKTGSSVSRSSILGFAALMLTLSGITRLVAAGCIDGLLTRSLIIGRPAILIGEPDELNSIAPTTLLRQFGLRDVGRVTVDGTASRGNKRAVQLDEAVRLARRLLAKEFIVAIKGDQAELLSDICDGLRKSPLPARLIPNKILRAVLCRNVGDAEAGLRLLDLQLSPMGILDLCLKRVMDIALSGLALVVLSPILLAVSVAIRFDSAGPIIFRQRRNGFNENVFNIYKFRSMVVKEEDNVVVQARKNDPRVTRVGRFLRRTSIDELPQLINVLKGEMSIVGPRPHALAHDDEYKLLIGDYYKRHHVKPGITGWAQVNGYRGETALIADMQDRVDCDIWYIKHWSLTLDLTIMLKTCFGVFVHDAY